MKYLFRQWIAPLFLGLCSLVGAEKLEALYGISDHWGYFLCVGAVLGIYFLVAWARAVGLGYLKGVRRGAEIKIIR